MARIRRGFGAGIAIFSVAIIFLFVYGGFALLPSAQIQLPPAEKNWKQVCQRAVAVALSPHTFAHPRSENWLRHCDSEALYYGFAAPPDFPAALQCAYYERAHPKPSMGDPFYGPGVLMMLYANGKGVPRDYDLAIRFACENTWHLMRRRHIGSDVLSISGIVTLRRLNLIFATTERAA